MRGLHPDAHLTRTPPACHPGGWWSSWRHKKSSAGTRSGRLGAGMGGRAEGAVRHVRSARLVSQEPQRWHRNVPNTQVYSRDQAGTAAGHHPGHWCSKGEAHALTGCPTAGTQAGNTYRQAWPGLRLLQRGLDVHDGHRHRPRLHSAHACAGCGGRGGQGGPIAPWRPLEPASSSQCSWLAGLSKPPLKAHTSMREQQPGQANKQAPPSTPPHYPWHAPREAGRSRGAGAHPATA